MSVKQKNAAKNDKPRRGQFDALKEFLGRLPAVKGTIGAGRMGKGLWWAKFQIAIDDKLAWNVVQALGHVLNYISLEERLPTIFMPVSPPPDLNGGPKASLSWVIESTEPQFTPGDCMRWLNERLPQPVDDPRAWKRLMQK